MDRLGIFHAGKGLPHGSLVSQVVYVVFCVFVTFPYGVSCQVWHLIVLIPDLCLPYYFRPTL